jgi:hypothetical protein
MVWEDIPGGGLAYWFFFRPCDYEIARQYFRGHHLDITNDKVVPTLELLLNAPFPIQIASQRLGDLVIVPVMALHVVLNKGSCASLKLAWNTLTFSGLPTSLMYTEIVTHKKKKKEVYQVETVIWRSTTELVSSYRHFRGMLQVADDNQRKALEEILDNCANVASYVEPVISYILHREGIEQDLKNTMTPLVPFDSTAEHHNIRTSDRGFEWYPTCDPCGRDIGNRFFQCCLRHGIDDDGDPRDYDICLGCYAEGHRCTRRNHLPERLVLKEMTSRVVLVDLLRGLQEMLALHNKPRLPLPTFNATDLHEDESDSSETS